MVGEKGNKPTTSFNIWKRYVDGGQKASKSVAPLIMDSWLRCREAGLDPYKSKVKIGNADPLEAKGSSARLFVDILAPYVSGLKVNSPEMDILIALFDCEGKLLYIDGDKRVLEETLALGIKERADLSEESAGTNAVALATRQRAAVTVLGYEHFCRDLHIFNTAATPIFNKEGGVDVILGVVSLRGASSGSHLMTILTGTAFFIEREIRLDRAVSQLKSYSLLVEEVLEESKDAVFVMTKHGYIKQLNPAALKMLDIDNYIQLNEPLKNLIKIKPSLAELSEKEGEKRREILVSINTPEHSFKAHAYVEPFFSKQKELLGTVVKLRRVGSEEKVAKKTPQGKYRFEDIIGESPAIQRAITVTRRAAETSISVLIEGDSGTGKEMFAQAIHNASERTDEPFVAVDCASIPKDLIESELFGHEEGAFTGARKEGATGKFEAADGGTIFLDEIGDMPLELQSRLLRVLESRAVTRIGSNEEIRVDIRVIAATSKKLMEMVERKEFRDDLYYRLSVVQVRIPPLRERPEDITLLLQHFIAHFNETAGAKIEGVKPELMERLLRYDWPGNAREVRNMIEHAFGVEKEGFISWEHLSDDLRETLLYKFPKVEEAKENDILAEEKRRVLDSEKQMYISAIEAAGRNMSKAAAVLGISRATLYRKLARLGIRR